MKKLLASFLSLVLFSSFVIIPSFAENESTTTNETEATPIETPIDEVPPAFTLPNNVRAVILEPSVDFGGDGVSEEELNKQLDNIFAKLVELNMNTVIIKTVSQNKVYYSSDLNADTDSDHTYLALEKAKQNGFYTLLTIDLDHTLSLSESDNILDDFIMEVHKTTLKYRADGYLLDGYYNQNNSQAYNDYRATGGGIGYQNYLYEKSEFFFKTASEIIRSTSNTYAVGLFAQHIWANSSTLENGSQTKAEFQAYKNGYADTKAFLEKGYVDFVIPVAEGGTSNESVPFETVVAWWNQVAESANVPLFITHANEKTTDWPEDQLLKQLSVAKKLSNYAGSVFRSFKSLVANAKNTTTNLVKYFENEIDESSLFSELTLYQPQRTSFTTYEDKVAFIGETDANFEAFLDGEKIAVKPDGTFNVYKDLKIGTNTIKFTHKDKTVTYNITRSVKVLQSISPTNNIAVEGESKLNISAVAYKGASLTATFNGRTYKLNEVTSGADEIDMNSAYTRFSTSITLPAGIIEKTQSLGRISIKGTYAGISETMQGGSVTINGLPKPPPPPPPPEIIEPQTPVTQPPATTPTTPTTSTPPETDASTSDTGSEPSTGTPTIPPVTENPSKPPENTAISGDVIIRIQPVDYGTSTKVIRTKSDNTLVYDAKTTDAWTYPNFVWQPKGTLDYFKQDSTAGSMSTYTSTTGRKYLKSETEIVTMPSLGKNQAFVKSIGTSNNKTFIKLALDKRITFNVQPVGITYINNGWGDNLNPEGKYTVDRFDVTHYEIVFDNVTEVTRLPSFDKSYVFKSGKWEVITVDNVQKFRLLLELRQPGIFGGVNATYDSNGDLMLTFNNITSSVSGKTIVIDPGHGYTGKQYIDPGAVGFGIQEYDINLAVAKQLEEKLTALGANVIRFKVEDKASTSKYALNNRKYLAESYKPDLYISIHANAGPATARGPEAYYYNAFSQPFAKAVADELGKAYMNNIYKDGVNRSRGAQYYRFNVTTANAFPSILVELGFVSNEIEAKAMSDATNQAYLADALKDGIVKYFARSSVSGYSNGSYDAVKPNTTVMGASTESTASTETTSN